MSAWGAIYKDRTDAVGRIMRAVEQHFTAFKDSGSWGEPNQRSLPRLEAELFVIFDAALEGRFPAGPPKAEVPCVDCTVPCKLCHGTGRGDIGAGYPKGYWPPWVKCEGCKGTGRVLPR